MRIRLMAVVVVLVAAVVAIVAPATADSTCTDSCWADLALAAPGWPTSVSMGAAGVLMWTVTNLGYQPAEDVHFRVSQAGPVAVGSVSSDAGACGPQGINGDFGCDLGTVAVGETIAIHGRYTADEVGSGTMVAHVSLGGNGLDRDGSNNELASPFTVTKPVRPIAAIHAATTPERILRTGGVRVRVTPLLAGSYAVDATIRGIPLVHVDVYDGVAGRAHDVFLGTTPQELSRIRRALRSRPRLTTVVTVATRGLTARVRIPVQA
jgi:hypothetical protein